MTQSKLGLADATTPLDLGEVNRVLTPLTAQQRVTWALNNAQPNIVLSSSFGIQAAVMLHLVTEQYPDIPVILTDTGYLFPETYQFIEQLTERLKLNLQTFRAELSPAWQEAKYGKLWLQGTDGIKKYSHLNKVEPMRQALQELQAQTWFSGIRQSQSESRAQKDVAEYSFIRAKQTPVLKIHPILEWTNKDVHEYLQQHDLPYHPLWEQGYVSVGDIQTSHKLEPGMTEEQTRFFGLTRECGLHEHNDGSGI